MLKVKIGNQEYPAVCSLGACRTFKQLTGKEIDQLSGISDMGPLLYCCVKSACRINGVQFKITMDTFCDSLMPDQVKVVTQLMEEAGATVIQTDTLKENIVTESKKKQE